MDNVTPFRITAVYKTVEIRRPDVEDGPVLTARVRRNLTMQQREAVPSIADKSKTMADLYKGIAPYIVEWNFEAETEDGTFAPVPAPADGGPETLKLLDDYYVFELYNTVLNAAYGGNEGSKEREARKNSLAASGDSATTSDAAESVSLSETTTESSGTDSSKPDEKTSSTKPRNSAKKKTI